MAYDFNADEIFQMAEQMERNGADFYNNASEGVDDPDSKQMLLKLAEMEVAHEKMFANMRSKLSEQDRTTTVFDPDNQSGPYMKALVDTRVFYEKEIDTTSMKEILKAAITAEKDSIVFYLGMREMVPAKQGKSKLDDIIREEMGHITILSKELMKYK